MFAPAPRILSAAEVAARLGKSKSWFRAHRPALEAQGFPLRDDLLGGWDAAAVDAFFDRRAGLVEGEGDDGGWMEAIDAARL